MLVLHHNNHNKHNKHTNSNGAFDFIYNCPKVQAPGVQKADNAIGSPDTYLRDGDLSAG